MKLWNLIAATTTLILSVNVNAAIVEIDWNLSGDNLITRDTSSGLDWLDLTVTNGMSYNTVSLELISGGSLEGWRYATNTEVTSLWSNWGLDFVEDTFITIPGLDPAVYSATDIIGDTFNNSFSGFTVGAVGMTSDLNPVNSDYKFIMGVYHVDHHPTQQLTAYMGGSINDTVHIDVANPMQGSYLVQVSSVPVPAAAWLFGSGLIGLVGFARRKKA